MHVVLREDVSSPVVDTAVLVCAPHRKRAAHKAALCRSGVMAEPQPPTGVTEGGTFWLGHISFTWGNLVVIWSGVMAEPQRPTGVSGRPFGSGISALPGETCCSSVVYESISLPAIIYNYLGGPQITVRTAANSFCALSLCSPRWSTADA